LKLAGDGGVNARVGSSVGGLHNPSGTKTLTGKPKSRTQRNSQIRGHTRAGSTNHALGIAKRDGRTMGAGYDLRTFRK
jgi:hypothetical protein